MNQPLVVILLVLSAGFVLALVTTAVVVFRNRFAVTRRVEALFRRPPRTPKAPGRSHYYKAYWS